jgi:hypothetical protein
MLKPSILWVVPTVALLAGCAHSAQTAATAATDCGFHFTGGSGLLGLMGATGAFERPPGPDCRRPASAGRQPPQLLEERSDADAQSGGLVAAPNIGEGQTIYSPNECIGAVVNGQCHGSILPDYSRPHPTCYGQMLNGMCTGPMF